MVGVFENKTRDLAGCLDALECTHGAGSACGSVHARSVELYDSPLIGEPAMADGLVVGVELLDLHTFDRGIEGIEAAKDQFPRPLHGSFSVG